MPTKRLRRTRRIRGDAAIRPSVQTWLETGHTGAMRADTGWLLVALPAEARRAYQRGDVAAARQLLAAAPAGHNYFVRG